MGASDMGEAAPRTSSDKRSGQRPHAGGARRKNNRPPSRRAAAAKSTPAPGDGPLVLVVDDYQDAREMCAEYLQFSGFRVAEAKNGIEAVEKAFDLIPDLVLMDLSLPGMDGWEATRRLKADARTKHIPVVALTGHALAGYSDGAKQAGCDAFITKPCLPDKLVVEIRKMLASTGKKAKG